MLPYWIGRLWNIYISICVLSEELQQLQRFGKFSEHDGLVLCGDFNDIPRSITYAGITRGQLSLGRYANIFSTPWCSLGLPKMRTRLRIMSGLCLTSQVLRLIEAQWNRSISGAIDLGLQITALITYFSPNERGIQTDVVTAEDSLKPCALLVTKFLSLREREKVFIANTHMSAKSELFRIMKICVFCEELQRLQRFGKCSTHDGLVLCGDFNDTPNSIIYAGITKGWLSLAKYKNIVSTLLYGLRLPKKEIMGCGVSSGGGQSSLGYLFSDAEAPKAAPEKPVEKPAPPPEQKLKEIPAGIPGGSRNNYFRAEGQNTGNFITDRPSTKVHSAPGGGSSLGYLFGDGGK